MRIKRIEYENFRNFKEHGEITFSEDGGITVIYGLNGTGKTTLHQLFQWILYGSTHFNATASDKMYNFDKEQVAAYGTALRVKGAIEFTNPNVMEESETYLITREWIYWKTDKGTVLDKKNAKCTLSKLTNNNWTIISKEPESEIDRMLPSGLAGYFFFDGEGLISDILKRSQDSAQSLRKALYSIFNIDVYQNALKSIGTQSNSKSTVLGHLYDDKSSGCTNSEVIQLKGQINKNKCEIQELQEKIEQADSIIARNKDIILDRSEKIGTTRSKKELEKKRKTAKNSIKSIDEAITKEEISFGTDVYRNYPWLLMSNVVKDAQNRIGLQVGEEHLLPGVNKTLIDALLKEDYCLCGEPMTPAHKKALENYLLMLPPLSYKSMYDNFTREANRWAKVYDPEILNKHISSILSFKENISSLQQDIQDYDEEILLAGNVDDLIAERKEAEKTVDEWEKKKNSFIKDQGVKERYLAQNMQKYNTALTNNKKAKEINKRIEVMEAVRQYFENKISQICNEYSKKLQQEIQSLVDEMLTTKRHVYLSTKFELSVRDEFGDEGKSGGQLGVISFAYIGGIFKVISSIKGLSHKEFPLVLDGPFSKIDNIQRQNVINTLSTFAPQIILFSMDDITQYFEGMNDVTFWTIKSDASKHVATVEQGYFPEVFKK